MSSNVFRRELEFGSLLSYSVKGMSNRAVLSKRYRDALKEDEAFPIPPIPMSVYYADIIRIDTRPSFASWFQANPVLIPIPTSSQSDWRTRTVPERIAFALSQKGLGRVVDEQIRLARTRNVPPSHSSDPIDRLTPQGHYETMAVQWRSDRRMMNEPNEILLIDDVVTQGSTFLGALNRLAEEFRHSNIRAFAMMRAMSTASDFHYIYEPVTGKITLGAGLNWPLRRP